MADTSTTVAVTTTAGAPPIIDGSPALTPPAKPAPGKGFRSVIGNMLFMFTTTGIVDLSTIDPFWQHIFTLCILAWGCFAIFMRLITNTPFGKKEIQVFEAKTGVPDSEVQKGLALLPQMATVQDLVDQTRALLAAVQVAPAPEGGTTTNVIVQTDTAK